MKQKYYLDKSVKRLLDRVKEKINNEDQEVWIAFYGDTGTGKSLQAQWWGHYIDPSIDISKVCFDKKEFVDAVIKSTKGNVIIGDEAISIMFSRSAMTKDNRLVMELVNQVRQKNLCIMLCIPDLLTMDKIALRKLNIAVYVYETRQERNGRLVTHKGNCMVYPNWKGRRLVDQLVMYHITRNNKKKRLPKPKCPIRQKGNPIGPTFKKPWYPVGELPYKTKKESILKKYTETVTPIDKKKIRYAEARNQALRIAYEHSNLSYDKLAKLMGISKPAIMQAIKQIPLGNSGL